MWKKWNWNIKDNMAYYKWKSVFGIDIDYKRLRYPYDSQFPSKPHCLSAALVYFSFIFLTYKWIKKKNSKPNLPGTFEKGGEKNKLSYYNSVRFNKFIDAQQVHYLLNCDKLRKLTRF